MLLSEAMRLGSLLGKQLFGMSVSGTDSCALGAVALACGYVDGATPFELFLAFPEMRGRITREGRYLIEQIVWLNDMCKTSRDQIADWIVANDYDCELARPTVNQCSAEVPICV